MYCIPLVGPTLNEASQHIRSILSKKNDAEILFEFRLDRFTSYPLDLLKETISSIRSLFTLHKSTQEEILKLADLGPTYFDMEYDTDPQFLTFFQKKYPHIKLILSYHNFDRTPDLDERIRLLKRHPADLYKIACHAQTSSDAWKMLQFSQVHANVLGISMGEKGKLTRILGPHLGSHWTYAYGPHATAEGQISFEELSSTYGNRRKTAFYGLIGDVSKSISHLTHNKVLQNALYVKMELAAEELKEFFAYMRHSPFQGLSVTMPLKEAVLPYLDEIDTEAQAIGAVNTLRIQEGKIKGYNTDGKGAIDVLEKYFPIASKKIVILGAGGAARSIIHEAAKRGANVFIYNRTTEKAKRLANHFGVSFVEHFPSYDILINTTPEPLPLPSDLIHPGSVVMDINTIPMKSRLLQEAEQKGCKIVFGYEMFIQQALGQLQIWEPHMDHTLAEKVLTREVLKAL